MNSSNCKKLELVQLCIILAGLKGKTGNRNQIDAGAKILSNNRKIDQTPTFLSTLK